MAVVAYKCPNCGAPLTFSPESQKFECSFCGAALTEEELKNIALATGEEEKIPASQGQRMGWRFPFTSAPAAAPKLSLHPLQWLPVVCTVTVR